jgi:hypothetical protein
MILQATLHSTLSTRIILKMREMASRDLAILHMSQSAGAFTTQLEFENYTSRQRNFMSQHGGAFSQDIRVPELRYGTRAARASIGSVIKDTVEE